MKKTKENKGITLVALIITIIVLLILAVVTISAVNEGSLFAHSNNAAKSYSEAAEKENTILSNYLTELGKHDGNIVPKETVDPNIFTYSGTGETITGLSSEGETLIEALQGKNYVLVIPEKNPDNITITAIGDAAFLDIENERSVFDGISGLTIELPNSITSIGEISFGLAECLNSINLQNVTEIGDEAFGDCTALRDALMLKVKTIGAKAFDDCTNLRNISIPEAITIEDNAFQDCSNLVKIEIPQTVTTIGRSVFNRCTNLTDIYCPGNVSQPEGWDYNWLGANNATVHWNVEMPTE